MPISQGFFDNVVSPNSYSAFPNISNMQMKDPTTEPSVAYNQNQLVDQYILARDEQSNLLDHSQNTSLNLQMNTSMASKYLNTSANIKLKSNIQNMQPGIKLSAVKASDRSHKNIPAESGLQNG